MCQVPPRLVVHSVSLKVEGTLSGVEELSVVDGGSADLYATGNTNGSDVGTFAFGEVTIDGRAISGGGATATLTLNDQSTLAAGSMTVAHGTVYVDGRVNMTAASVMNVTSDGVIDGQGRSTYAQLTGPGTPETSGCTWNTANYGNDKAASHGGLGGSTSAECAYGSTFWPVTVGSGGKGGTGGAALRLEVSGELWLDGSIVMDASAASAHWSGGSGGSAWVTAGVMRGSGGSVSADGGERNGDGDAGGGGGRIALYCTSSAYGSNDSAHGWALPALHAYGGQGSSDVWDGGCGTVYIDCAAVSNTLLMDNGNRDATPLTTKLVDVGMTTYAFDEVKLLGGATLGFAPWYTGTAAITVSVSAASGDQTGKLVLEPMSGRTNRVVGLLTGRVDGQAFVSDSTYQASSLSSQSAASWEVYWTRLYYLSDVHMLSQMSVEIA